MTETLAFAAFGVAVLVFLAVLGVLGLVAMVRAVRRKPETPRPAPPVYAAPIQAAQSAPAPSPTFVSLAREYSKARQEEEEIKTLKESLDKIALLTTKIASPVASSAPPPNA